MRAAGQRPQPVAWFAERLIKVKQHTEMPSDIRQRWIGLRVWFFWPEISWGAWWAALCGSLAAGVFYRGDVASALKLILVLVIADPLWANMAHLLCDLNWSVDGCAQSGERKPVQASFLPYMKGGSPGYRIGQWFSQTLNWYRMAFCPQAGWMLSSLVFQGMCVAGIGLVLDSSVLALLGFGMALMVLSLLLRGCCPALCIAFRAAAEAGVSCLVGYVTFGPWSALALGLAATFTVLYAGALHISTRGMDRAAWLMAITLLVLPIGCAILGKPFVAALLLAGCVFPVWLCWHGVRRAALPRWYLIRIRPYLMGLTFVASVALGLG